jgi:hypothetical protein
MYSRSKHNSQLNVEAQSRYNYYDSQNPTVNESPSRKRGGSKLQSNKRLTQVAEKIQDVIELCIGDRNDGNQEFESIANAERGILDLLVGSELQEVHLPANRATSQYSNYPPQGTIQGGNFRGSGTGFAGSGNTFQNQGNQQVQGDHQRGGSKPFLDISQTPTPQDRNPSIRAQLANNPRAVIGDDAL